jgi:beta-glucanase (GH16 family)
MKSGNHFPDRSHHHLIIPWLSFLALALILSVAHGQDKPGWQLVWSDEFTDPVINSSKWSFETGPVNVNSELEYYSNSAKNAFVDSGSLIIRALKENVGGRNYTSSKMQTRMKGDWLYGRIEVKAKLPSGKGIWPAIWMMPTDNAYGGWPSSGEMDIMELLGHQPAKVYATVHWNSGGHQQQGGSKTLTTGTFADSFHNFAYEWDVGAQRWYIDDVLYFSTARGQPFDKRFYLILNVAVGGGWPGNPDATTVFPTQMSVDFVRVYKKGNGTGITTIPSPAPGLRISRNPVPDQTVLTNESGESRVVVSDMSGRVLERHVLAGGETLAFGGDLPKGMYFLEMVSGAQRRTAKLIKSP